VVEPILAQAQQVVAVLVAAQEQILFEVGEHSVSWNEADSLV
jgi:hypothetical protein